MEFRKMVTIILFFWKTEKETQMYRIEFWTLWERWGWDVSREQHWNMYYQGWNRSPAQVGCMRQVLGPGVLGRPRGIGWRGRWEGGSGWGIHVNPWLIHFNIWQNQLQYCKIISLQLIKINGKNKIIKNLKLCYADTNQEKVRVYILLLGKADPRENSINRDNFMIIKETFSEKKCKCSVYIYSLTENTRRRRRKNLTNCRKWKKVTWESLSSSD